VRDVSCSLDHIMSYVTSLRATTKLNVSPRQVSRPPVAPSTRSERRRPPKVPSLPQHSRDCFTGPSFSPSSCTGSYHRFMEASRAGFTIISTNLRLNSPHRRPSRPLSPATPRRGLSERPSGPPRGSPRGRAPCSLGGRRKLGAAPHFRRPPPAGRGAVRASGPAKACWPSLYERQQASNLQRKT